MRARLLILLFALLCIVIYFNRNQQHHNLYTSDACGYYLFLPASFIYHDLGHLRFYNELDQKYHLNLEYSLYSFGGKVLDKYAIGTALGELPLFLVAHLYSNATGLYDADGFTLAYQVAGMLSDVLWVALGLLILYGLLRKYYSEHISLITIVCLAFGTNLYAYTAFIHGMSHGLSFLLFAATLRVTDAWYDKPKLKTALLLGVLLGWIAITRPINALLIVVVILWKVDSLEALKDRMKLLTQRRTFLMAGVAAFLVPVFVQLAYWHYITGHWIYYSYQGEGFVFPYSHIVNGLFSYRKGWLVYTPMAAIALAGFIPLWRRNRSMAIPLFAFMVMIIYCVFSWRQWWYGGGFGCRPLIESYAVLSLPLAAALAWINGAGARAALKMSVYALIFVLIVLNIFQTYQYSMGLIHWSRMTKTFYWKIFGKTEFDRKANEQYLIPASKENN